MSASSSIAAARSVASTGQRISSVNRAPRAPAGGQVEGELDLLAALVADDQRGADQDRRRVDRGDGRLGRCLRRTVRVDRGRHRVVGVRLGASTVHRVGGDVHQPGAGLGRREGHVGGAVGTDGPAVRPVCRVDHDVRAHRGDEREHRRPVGDVQPGPAVGAAWWRCRRPARRPPTPAAPPRRRGDRWRRRPASASVRGLHRGGHAVGARRRRRSAFGLASMPASSRCWAVIGVGAPVSGS